MGEGAELDEMDWRNPPPLEETDWQDPAPAYDSGTEVGSLHSEGTAVEPVAAGESVQCGRV
jgi:hypothetical protein